MRPARRPFVAALAVVAALALPSAALADCPGAESASPASAEGQAATLCLLNAERAAQGLAPMAEDAALDRAAADHAAAMVAQQFFAHESPDGGTLLDRLRAAGWLPASGDWTAGEDIAWGSGDRATPTAIVAAWMASPGHRANILRPVFDQVGIGIAAGVPQAGVDGGATYVADFGMREEAAAAPALAPAPRSVAVTRPKARRHAAATCGRSARAHTAVARRGHGKRGRKAARCGRR